MLTNLSVVLGAAGIYGELPFLLFWIAVINELLRLLTLLQRRFPALHFVINTRSLDQSFCQYVHLN